MTLTELEGLVREAAADLATRRARPIAPVVVLPGPTATSVTTLEGFPDDDIARFEYLSRLAADRIRPSGTPCYGFIAEASVDSSTPAAADDGPAGAPPAAAADVLVVVFGARRRPPQIMAAPFADPDGGGLADFTPAEPLDPTAMPFLSPLQHAVDAAEPPDVTGGSVLG